MTTLQLVLILLATIILSVGAIHFCIFVVGRLYISEFFSYVIIAIVVIATIASGYGLSVLIKTLF